MDLLLILAVLAVCVLMLRQAWRNRIPRSEWVGYCFALAVGLTLLGGGYPSALLIGFYAAAVVAMLLATFILPHKELADEVEKLLRGDCPTGCARLHAKVKEGSEADMALFREGTPMGRFEPANKLDNAFTYYGEDLSMRRMLCHSAQAPFDYTLEGGGEPAQLRGVEKGIVVEGGGLRMAAGLPLGHRFITLGLSVAPERAVFSLYPDGFTLFAREDEALTLACCAYWLWLHHFGNCRLD